MAIKTSKCREWAKRSIMESIEIAYEFYTQGLTFGEPRMSITMIRESLETAHRSTQPVAWRVMTTSKRNAYVYSCLKTLTKQGKLVQTTGISKKGREAKMWEPAPEKEDK